MKEMKTKRLVGIIRSMDSYHIKKQLLGEVHEAIRVKELNVELMEHLTFTSDWLLRYCERMNLKPPNIDKLQELISRAGDLVQKIYEPYSHLPTELQQRFKTPDDSTEHKILLKQIMIIKNDIKQAFQW
jgi:hypothetical protein